MYFSPFSGPAPTTPCTICEAAELRAKTPAQQNPRWKNEFNRLRDFRHDSYINIYEACPNESRIFGTESLYGDWDAEILLLAKDFAPWHFIKHRIDIGSRAFRASCPCKDGGKAMGVSTNRNLVSKLIPELTQETRLLYGSVCGGLMRNDGKTSGRLPDWESVRTDYAAVLIDFVIGHLPNLKFVVAMGKEAWDAVSATAGSAVKFADSRDSFDPVTVAGYPCFATFHPSRWSGQKHKQWHQLVERLTL
jgi:hypothetical protein